MHPPMAVGQLDHPSDGILLVEVNPERASPRIRENSHIDAEGLGDFPELAFLQVRLASDISGQGSLG